MIQYPLKFPFKASAQASVVSAWQTSTPTLEQQLPAAIPPEFSGPGGGYSPEDFYALAIANCFVATFKVFAEKSRLTFETIEVTGHLEVDRDEKGAPWMARVFLHVHLRGPSSAENAQRLLDKVKNSCLVLNSIKTEKIFEFKLS